MSAAVPAAADVSTRDWLRSGMVVHLLQMRTPSSAAASTTKDQSLLTDNGQAPVQRCIARGVLQADALLDGAVQECSNRLSLLTELPLFDARGVRLGIQSVQESACEVRCSVTCKRLRPADSTAKQMHRLSQPAELGQHQYVRKVMWNDADVHIYIQMPHLSIK